MFKDSFKRLIKEAEEAPSFSDLEIKKQSQIWDWNIAPMFKAWADIASAHCFLNIYTLTLS